MERPSSRTRRRYAFPWLLVFAAAGSITCGGGDLQSPDEPVPAFVKVLRGDAQQGEVGQALPDSIVVEVTDAGGNPVSGRVVTFLALDSVPGAGLSPRTATTDSAGRASALPILGRQPGPWPVEVRVSIRTGRAITAELSLTATVGAPDSLVRARGEGQGGRVGQTLGDSLEVEAVDRFGNPVSGVTVAWSAKSGGTVSAEETETGADGNGAVSRRLGPATGAQTATATVAALKGSPVVFHHTAFPRDVAVLIPVRGGGQRGPAGGELEGPLVVRAEDENGNPIVDKDVSWSATSGGHAEPATSTTDGDGLTQTRWTLGDDGGTQSLTARMSGLPAAVFSANVGAGAPVALEVETQPSASASSGAAFGRQPRVELRDAGGNPVAADDIDVTVALDDDSGGTLAGARTVSTRQRRGHVHQPVDLRCDRLVHAAVLRLRSHRDHLRRDRPRRRRARRPGDPPPALGLRHELGATGRPTDHRGAGRRRQPARRRPGRRIHPGRRQSDRRLERHDQRRRGDVHLARHRRRRGHPHHRVHGR